MLNKYKTVSKNDEFENKLLNLFLGLQLYIIDIFLIIINIY